MSNNERAQASPMHNSPWLRLGRGLALIGMLLCIGLFLIGMVNLRAYAARNPGEFTLYDWTAQERDGVLVRYGLSFFHWIRFQQLNEIINAAIFCTLGMLIFFRKASDWFSLYVAVILVLFGTLSGHTSTILAGIYPGWGRVIEALGVFAWAVFLPIFFLFPDGRFVPGWSHWAALGLLVMLAWDILFYGSARPPLPLVIILLALLGVGIGSQGYRYRNISSLLQRQQTKWVLLALLFVFGVLIISIAPFFVTGGINPESPAALVYILISVLSGFIISLIPLSIGLAILRYRLWDIDVIIRRTLVYGVLTAALALVFFGGVTLLQSLFQAVSGQQSAASIVISTLAIAALFNPLRKRVQDFIDRRFYRRKYSAEQALARFAATARSQTDIEQLSDELLAVVQETMQPESASLWIKPYGEKR